ncbi:exopolysaccharide biosynthesis polyprenyl glycosylphosphotransferase [Pseudotenacibaculum sp. MALMAid0570]|uniref:exopolysaccharide biosynthesis polyprenyl glycosylphosphotransferase n=1 Tax=Pseudotenacibaculum sp. MALMAid0570 TaxID=3143938 RepID=UPI0032DE5CC4
MSLKITHIDLSERKILLRSLDVFVIISSLWLSSKFLIQEYIAFDSETIYQWLILLVFYYFLFAQIFQLYDLNISSSRFKISRSLFLTTVITTLFFTFTPYLSPSLPEKRIEIIYLFVLMFIPVLIWRFIYMWVLFSPKFFKDIIVISHSSRMGKMLDLVKERGFHNVICYISNEENKSYGQFYDIENIDVYKLVKEKGAKEVVLSTRGFPSTGVAKLNNNIIALFEEGINIKSFESFYEEITDRVPKEYLDHHFYKNINLSSNSEKKLYLFFHRFLDIIVSIIGLLAFIPFIPILLILNLIANRGPLFYTQKRVGQKGKIFTIFKLRSMVVNAESLGAQYAEKNDKRITSFGKFLRNTRIDEAPQFFNILKGDMSLIGPRPERPEFVKDLEDKIPFYAIRHVVKPGLTGWAQVNFPYAGNLDEQEKKLRYDLFYIKEQSAYLDFKIIIKTMTTVLFFRGQ